VKELIKVEKTLQYSRSSKDVVNNQQWVRAFVTIMVDKVPSTFSIADVIRCIDNFFDGALLNACDTKEADSMAFREAVKLKKVIGHLSYLFRNTNDSNHPILKDLKTLLQRRSAPQKRKKPAPHPIH